MSRLTLGGRKRAGGKVHERLRQSEKENANGDEEKDDLRQTVTESYDSSSYTPKYTYFFWKILLVMNTFLESENSLLLAVVSAEQNLAGRSFCTNI